jgi:hypothetical protein
MVLCRLLPLRVAVTMAAPGRPAATGIATATCPMGTDADAGTEATAESLLARAIVVAADCGALIVAVSVPEFA